MRISAFEIAEPIPELNEPHALAIIPSWMDAGAAAGLTLSLLEQAFESRELARLASPGEFFDFTRYRPMISKKEGAGEILITNAVVTYGSRQEGCEFIFLRLPEPHAQANVYIDSVVELLKYFGVKRYGLLGSVYDMLPYTRPLLVTGSSSNQGLQNSLSDAKVVTKDFEGPTTILHLLTQQIEQSGIDTFNAVVHLPGYQTPDNDYRGENKLLEVMGSIYGLPVPQEVIEKAKGQEEQFKQMAEQFLLLRPELKVMLNQLEENYDARVKDQKHEIHLSAEVEKFLKEMNGRFEQG